GRPGWSAPARPAGPTAAAGRGSPARRARARWRPRRRRGWRSAGPGGRRSAPAAVWHAGNVDWREMRTSKEMGRLHLTAAIGDYDHVRDLWNGAVQVEGIELTHLELSIEETFDRFLRFREWEVTEMS